MNKGNILIELEKIHNSASPFIDFFDFALPDSSIVSMRGRS